MGAGRYMPSSKFNFAFNTIRLQRLGVGTCLILRALCLFIVVSMFLACATLPTPGTKKVSYSYDPHPDSSLAVVTDHLIADAVEYESKIVAGFPSLKFKGLFD